MHRGIDLKSKPVQPLHARHLQQRRADEFWQIDLCTTDGLSSFQEFSTLCQTLPGRLQTQDIFLLGSVSLHELRAANLSRKSARYRSLPARATHQALPSRHSRPSLAQYLGPCELGTRLAHLRRLRAGVDYPRSSALRKRQLRSRRFLCDGSRLPRFRALVQVAPRCWLLCHPCPKAVRFPATLLAASRPSYGSDLRSDYYARQSRTPQRLSRKAAPHSLFRRAIESTTRLSDQQLQLATTDYRPTISQPLAGRVVLQMDQATPAHQEFLRHFRKRLTDSNLDRDLGLRARGHSEKGIASRRQPLQNVTDLQRHSLRENPHFTGPFFSRRSNRLRRSLQTTDSVPLTLGQ